jgi:hypothetical protein
LDKYMKIWWFSTIIIEFIILSNGWSTNMYQCVLIFSYYSHNLLNFSYKNMSKI